MITVPMLQRLVKRLHVARWLLIVALLVGGIFLHPGPTAVAVESSSILPTDAADVVIDGRPVFQLAPSGPYTAQQRVNQANRQLALLTRPVGEIEVTVVERNQQPTIVANGQYLLTVTDLDTSIDKTPVEQAEEWADQLRLLLRQARDEREPAEVKRRLWLAGFTLLGAIALHISIGYFWRRSSEQTLRQTVPKNSQTGRLSAQDSQLPIRRLKLGVARLGLWLFVAWYISSLFPTLRQRRYDLFNNPAIGIRAPLFSLGDESYNIVDLLILLVLLWGLFTLVQLSTRLLATQVLRRTQLARGAKEVVTQAYRYSALALGTLILLQIWGIDLRSLALLGSALGIGIGFGFQDIARNFGSGLVLLFERSIQVGDFIEVEPHTGVVERIGTRSITLRTLDNISVLVPNAHLLNSQVMNWNHDHPVSRLRLSVGVAYGTNVEKLKASLLQVAQEHSEVLSKPSPDVYFRGFGDNAIEFDLLVWIRSPERHLAIRSSLYFQIEEILRQHEISIPYPQRDLHLRTEQVPIAFSPDVTEALIKAFGEVKPADNSHSKPSGSHDANT